MDDQVTMKLVSDLCRQRDAINQTIGVALLPELITKLTQYADALPGRQFEAGRVGMNPAAHRRISGSDRYSNVHICFDDRVPAVIRQWPDRPERDDKGVKRERVVTPRYETENLLNLPHQVNEHAVGPLTTAVAGIVDTLPADVPVVLEPSIFVSVEGFIGSFMGYVTIFYPVQEG